MICSKCKIEKPEEAFYASQRRKTWHLCKLRLVA